MNRRSFFVFAAVFMMILMAFSFALAADEMVYIDGDSQKVSIDEEALSSEWTILPEGDFEAPTISIRVLDRSKLDVENGEYIIPVTVKLEKPNAIANMEAEPYLRKVRIVNGEPEGYDVPLTGPSFVYNIYAPDDILNEGFVDFFTIRWKNSNDEILMREVLQYIVSTEGYTDPFEEVARPDRNRIRVILDEKLTEGNNPAVTYEFAQNGDLTFTVHEISKEIIKALYTPGMNCILGDAEITAPGVCNQLWEVTGNITYEAFVNGYTNGTYRENQTRFSNGRELWKIDETEEGIAVIPMENTSHYYLCWQDDEGNKYPEILKITVKMADDAKVVTIPENELDPVTNVPASRIRHGGPEDMKNRAIQAGAVFSYDEQNGIALFAISDKTPEDVISLAETNNWSDIPLDIWVQVPEGCEASGTYTIGGWTGEINICEQGGVQYAEIGRAIYDSRDGIVTQDVNVVFKWNKTDGSTMMEKFRFKSTFPNYTWMDIYWAPAPAELLTTSVGLQEMKDMGFNVDISAGKVHCYFDKNEFPTVDEIHRLMNTRLTLSANMPAGTAKVKRNASSGSMGSDYNTRISDEQKEIINNSGSMEAQGLFMGNICPLQKRSVGNMGIDYYCAITENNLVVLVQFYDESGNIIEVENKEGYYFTLEVEPFHYAVSSTVVDDIAKAEKDSSGIVQKPTLVLPELGNNTFTFTFTAQLFPQQINSSDKNPNIKYYLRLETDVPASMLEGGVDVYIPYSMIHPDLTYEKALDDKKFKVAHLNDDDSHKENLFGEPTEYGMKFIVDSFSPFVIEVENEEQSGNNTPGNTGSSGGSGISVTYNGGNSFSTSKSAVPTSVEIDGVEVSFTGNGKNFTVSSIPAGAKWITVRWNSTSITVSFKPDAAMVYADMAIPKTGDVSILMPVLMLLGAAAIRRRK